MSMRRAGIRMTVVVALAGQARSQPADAPKDAPAPPAVAPATPFEALTDANLATVRDLILPKPGELAWRDIPWRAALWDGVRDAQGAGKPLLLWAMNGHPLACT